jgi:hypothetical protein
MTKITIQKLIGMFPKQLHAVEHGDCIVIPGDRFDPDWEADLAEQGHGCFEVELDAKPVMLVALNTLTVDQDTSEVASPETAKKESKRGCWAIKEEQALMHLASELPGPIERQFANMGSQLGRSAKAVQLKYYELKRIEKREREKGKHDEGCCPECGLPVDLCACTEIEKEKRRAYLQVHRTLAELGEETEPDAEPSARELAEKHWLSLQRWLHVAYMVYMNAFVHGFEHGCKHGGKIAFTRKQAGLLYAMIEHSEHYNMVKSEAPVPEEVKNLREGLFKFVTGKKEE